LPRKNEAAKKRSRVILTEDILYIITQNKEIFLNNIKSWGKANFREYSWRENRTPYRVLIAELLLKRTTAKAVQNIYNSFISDYPEIYRLSLARKSDIEAHLVKIGYQKIRSDIILSVSKFIVDKYGGVIPYEKDELLAVPHIGEYTANAIITFSYNKPTFIVDTNIIRILTRVFGLNCGKDPLPVIEKVAEMLYPINENAIYNYGLLDLGGLICRPRNPVCYKCPVLNICSAYKEKECNKHSIQDIK
jgi:A/G-specific adenine glycosylase